MKLTDEYQIKTISDYCNQIITGKAKQFISQYEYYLTIFSVRDFAETKDFKQTEKNFILFSIRGIKSYMEMTLKLDLTKLEKVAIETELDTSLIFIYRKLTKVITKTKIVSNPYKRIFCSDNAYSIFNELNQHTTNPLADYSFIYRKMIKDNLIFESVGESEFRRFLSSNYEVEIDKMKQLHICSTGIKEQLYSIVKDSIKE